MKCACSSAPVLALLALVGLGAVGFNMARHGCPLGTCSEPAPAATLTPASTVATPASDCPMHCESGKAEADVQAASHHATGNDCCAHKDGACCESMGEKECAEKMAEGCLASKGECPHAKVAEKDKGAN